MRRNVFLMMSHLEGGRANPRGFTGDKASSLQSKKCFERSSSSVRYYHSMKMIGHLPGIGDAGTQAGLLLVGVFLGEGETCLIEV